MMFVEGGAGAESLESGDAMDDPQERVDAGAKAGVRIVEWRGSDRPRRLLVVIGQLRIGGPKPR